MPITNTTKPSSSMTNTAKAVGGQIWDTDLNTWAAETRTWADTVSTIDNISRVTSSITNTTKPV